MASQRYENIDALRAIAALAVLVQHFFGDVVRDAANASAPLVSVFQTSLESFDLGRFGVVLFFLISGFVIPFSIRGERPLRRFAISRFFRLYPAMWLAILLLSVIFIWEGKPVSMATIVANMTMLPAFLGQPWMSGIYWTLSIELIFYALCALLYWRGLLFRPLIVTSFAFLLIASTVVPVLLIIFANVRLPVQYIGLHVSFLFCGLLLRMALVDKIKWAGAGAALVAIAQFDALMAVSGFSLQRGDSFFLIGKGPIIYAYIAAFVVFIASIKTARPQSQLLSLLGALSYSIYLFHGLVAIVVYRFLPLTGELPDLFIGLVCVALTFVVSWLVYTFLEVPMIAMGRKVQNRTKEKLAVQNG